MIDSVFGRCFPNGVALWIKIWRHLSVLIITSILTRLKWRPKPSQSLHCVLQMGIHIQCCTSLLTSFVHNDDYLNQIFHIWINDSRPVTTDFQSSSCVIRHTSAFSPCWLPSFNWDDFWGGFRGGCSYRHSRSFCSCLHVKLSLGKLLNWFYQKNSVL